MEKISKKQINSAMVFFRQSLFDDRPRLGMNTIVDVRVKKNNGADGWCEVEDDDRRPREFLILLEKSLDELSLLYTLAHEMVHVWQFATGRLKHMADGGWKYQGKKYSSDTPYIERPWEGEAYEKEQELVSLWLNRNTT